MYISTVYNGRMVLKDYIIMSNNLSHATGVTKKLSLHVAQFHEAILGVDNDYRVYS